jgi:hypothetical protein
LSVVCCLLFVVCCLLSAVCCSCCLFKPIWLLLLEKLSWPEMLLLCLCEVRLRLK